MHIEVALTLTQVVKLIPQWYRTAVRMYALVFSPELFCDKEIQFCFIYQLLAILWLPNALLFPPPKKKVGVPRTSVHF